MFKKRFHLLVLSSFFLLLSSGCVSQKTHLKVADEAKRFRQASERQDNSIKNLKTKLAKIKAKTKKTEKLSKKQSETIKNLKTKLAKIQSKKEELEEEIVESEREVKIQRQLIASLKDEIKAGHVEITKIANQTNIRLKDSILFDSGKATLKPNGIKILKKLGKQLKTIKDRQILIEGHTDNMLLRERLKSVYSSNLELSAARSLAVANYKIQQIGVPGKRVVVLAYGQHRPIADNKSPEGRKKNRRVTIVLVKLNEIFDDYQDKTK